ncbi:MAG: riboflavin biosynthesis protein RibF [Paludibacteraceae bacterium]|nr:riboflavin biosynthesis protein RibF [Paludibacteraceae bacterium]
MPAIATIGFFDGVHKGHRYLFEQLRGFAGQYDERALIFTFLQHPRSVLTHDCPPLLTTTEERERMLGGYGDVHFFDFAEVQPLTALQFLDYLADRWKVRHLLMGYNHHFGSDGRMSDEQYADIARQVGMKVLRAEPYSENDLRPSSTKIRNLLLQGDVAEANAMLGYDYQLTGRVVHGRMIGRQIGFPTANIMPAADKLIPKAGVYRVEVRSQMSEVRSQMALVNIGTNPTVGNTHQTIEVHIPGFEGDLYNQTLTLQFVERIRGEQRFDSLEELREQINKDLKSIIQ